MKIILINNKDIFCMHWILNQIKLTWKTYELKFDFVKEYGSNMKLLSRFEVRKIISILRICLMLNHGKGNDISS